MRLPWDGLAHFVTLAGVGFHASTQPTFILYLIPPTYLEYEIYVPLADQLFTIYLEEINRLSWICWVKCILRYSPAGEEVEGTTPDTEDTKIDRSYVS